MRARTLIRGALAGTAAGLLCSAAMADDDASVTVISSRTASDYVRPERAGGTSRSEAYAFGDGGSWSGAVVDPTFSHVVFLDVAKAIMEPLAKQGYVPTKDPRATRELIMVYWGRTQTPERYEATRAAEVLQNATQKALQANRQNNEKVIQANSPVNPPAVAMPCGKFEADTTVDQVTGLIDANNALEGALALNAAQNQSRDLADEKNAELLGFDSWWNATAQMDGTPLAYRRQDLISELEHDRYFVILMAYDFQEMWKHKKHKILWETRFSVRERGTDFSKALPLMAADAAKYFGKDSNGLIRDTLPAGRVDVGPLKTLGVVASDSK
ncbi:MAG TPA: hypothetical protein VGG34_03350 [Opitutaceae bacterium]